MSCWTRKDWDGMILTQKFFPKAGSLDHGKCSVDGQNAWPVLFHHYFATECVAIFNDTNMTKHNRRIIVKPFKAKALHDTPTCSKVGCWKLVLRSVKNNMRQWCSVGLLKVAGQHVEPVEFPRKRAFAASQRKTTTAKENCGLTSLTSLYFYVGSIGSASAATCLELKFCNSQGPDTFYPGLLQRDLLPNDVSGHLTKSYILTFFVYPSRGNLVQRGSQSVCRGVTNTSCFKQITIGYMNTGFKLRLGKVMKSVS